MSSVVAAVLLAAALHAGWNALAHAITDRLVTFTLLSATAAVAAAVAIPFVGFPSAASWPLLAASAVLHLAYNGLLMRSYRLGDFNQAYPLARGTSPWVVAIIATLVVGEELATRGLIGVLVISAGLATLIGRPHRKDLSALTAAFCTGLTIAAYTVVDGVGVRRSGTTLGYIAWLFLLEGVPIPLYAAAARGRRLGAQLRPLWRQGVAGGLLSVGAYGLVLWAQTRGALAAIAALRESSIVMGAVIGAVFFHEHFGRTRFVATVIVVIGIVLVA